MTRPDVIINNNGTFIRHEAAQLIQISKRQLPLNAHGGYISPQLAVQCEKQSITVAPSALVGDIIINPQARGIEIGANCAVGDGTHLMLRHGDYRITLEEDVIIGRDNLLAHNLKIKRGARIAARNKLIGNIVDNFKDPAYNLYSIGRRVRVGSDNVLNENFTLEHDCQLGNANTVETELELRAGVLLGNNNWLASYSRVDPGARLGSDCLLHPDVIIGENCRLANGVVINAKTILQARVAVAAGVHVGRQCEIHAAAQLGYGAKINEGSSVGAQAEIQAGAIIGAGSNLAAGVLIKSGITVPPRTNVFPGKIQDFINRGAPNTNARA